MAQLPADQREGPRAPPDSLSRARSILLSILGVELAVLLVTGIALFFLYRPTASQAWNDLLPESYAWDVRVAQGLRLLHRLASWLAVSTAIAAGIVVAVGGRARVRRWGSAALGTGIAITALAGSFTGVLLPWDQLGLWAVTVGSNASGYRILFGDRVRFVLMGGVEISPDTIVRWLLVHMLVLGPALAGLVVVGWRRHRADVAAANAASDATAAIPGGSQPSAGAHR
jgi:quinol-cytochrome oxidoreductase complex cytochrome b subunit